MRKVFLFAIMLWNTFYFSDLLAQAYKPGTLKNGVKSGDIRTLDNVKEVNIFYDYSEMIVGDKKLLGEDVWVKEEEYLEKKCKDVEEKEGVGKGQEYREKWGKWMTSQNNEEFSKLFNKWAKEINMSGINNGAAFEHTLTVKTVKAYIGYPHQIDAFFIFTDGNGKNLVTIFLRDLAGSPNALYHAYGKAAKEISDGIKMERKKVDFSVPK
jgi:hypothetical protein